MCEKKIRKITKGTRLARLREARRTHRLQSMTPSPSTRETPHATHRPHLIVLPIDKAVQNKIILELAWKTVALMHKNKIIQQKIIALQKETSEFVANIMKNPENRMRYAENMRNQANAAVTTQNVTVENKENNSMIFKTEPNA